jgi:hypothetical protein
VKRRQPKNTLIITLVIAVAILLLLYLVFNFEADLKTFILRFQLDKVAAPPKIIAGIELVLLGILAYIVVRALSFLVFGMFRLRKGFEAPTLVRNVFSIVVFSLLFLLIFSFEFPTRILERCSQRRRFSA